MPERKMGTSLWTVTGPDGAIQALIKVDHDRGGSFRYDRATHTWVADDEALRAVTDGDAEPASEETADVLIAAWDAGAIAVHVER